MYYPPEGPASTAGAPPGATRPAPADPTAGGTWAMGKEYALARTVLGLATGETRDYYRKSSITGTCMLHADASDRIGVPCNRVEIALADLDGKELVRMQTGGDGKFGFYVNKEQRYRLKVSGRLRHANEADGLPGDGAGENVVFRMGDEVTLRLVRK